MAQALDIERVDLECEFNNRDHHTELNGVDRLIVRRGQPFNISLYLRKSYQPGVSCLDCVTQTGLQPSEESGTRTYFGLSANIDTSCWSATVGSPCGELVALTICSPPDAPVGRYALYLGQSVQKEFILLFNPWCPGDAVYMEDQRCLEEYVLAQDGIIFCGTRSYRHPLPWNFGQFESGILDICLRILDVNPKCLTDPGSDCSDRRSPVYVSRMLSAMVNSNDADRGVIQGKWFKPYDRGVSPLAWRGSVDILRKWDGQQCQPVLYGQCWVFAAVACSVARALGIPCRVVTNFNSAHDSNGNLVIECYRDENGKPIQGKEMLWNFHCWVESWMTRPDLQGSNYNGWQASDPTPQERSDGVFCCGPVPLKAIKEGQLMMKYDAPFVFAEVNADYVCFTKKSDGSVQKTTNSTTVGQFISTKSVGSDDREDITHLYKYPEGSQEELEVFVKAKRQIKRREEKNEGVDLAIKVSPEMRKGCDFDVFAVVTNATRSQKTSRLVFKSCSMSYNGVVGGCCGYKELLNVQLAPGGTRKIPLRLNYSKYGEQIAEENLIHLVAVLTDVTSGEINMAMRNIMLENPEIKVRILGEPKVDRKLAAEITMPNPLPEPLRDCCFHIEGANLTGGSVISERLSAAVGPGEDAKVKIYFTPNCCGLRKLLVGFDSDKLHHVKGYKDVIIGK